SGPDARGERIAPSPPPGHDEQPWLVGVDERRVVAGPRLAEDALDASLRRPRLAGSRKADGRPRAGDCEEAAARDPHSLQPSFDEAVDGGRGVVELLVAGEAVARLHLGDEPAVVADLLEGLPDRLPVVVAEEEVGVDALFTAAAAVTKDVLDVDAGDARAVYLDPLLGKAGIVDVPDVE